MARPFGSARRTREQRRQPLNQLAAISSPCYKCHALGKDGYPDCSEQCGPLNSYLIQIGDKPHDKSSVDPKLFGARKYKVSSCCTEQEFLKVSRIIFCANKKLKLTSQTIADQTGISVYVIRCILRSAQKTMSVDNYNRILAWNDREGILDISKESKADIEPDTDKKKITTTENGRSVMWV